ncbi:MAG: hypothetical protein ACK2UC_06035 [Anaerolineae bacterium]|jgi:ABC-type protease/lipase transport system fused ATPase/permease subunit
MESICFSVAVVALGLGLLAGVGVLILVLIKLGVVAQYATREELTDTASYSLDESREAGKAGPGSSQPDR